MDFLLPSEHLRQLLLIFCFAGLTAPALAQGQTLARAEVTATVRVPDFLSMRIDDPTPIGSHARSVTVYVTANRGWQLSVTNACGNCVVRVQGGEGRGGNDTPVFIEYEWPEGTAPPHPTQIQYILIPS